MTFFVNPSIHVQDQIHTDHICMTNFEDVFCDGRYSCRYSTISGTVEALNVDCGGAYSCRYSSITADISGSYLYCESKYSCQFSIISGNFDSIYCRGYASCEYAAISGINDNTELICDAQYACALSTISSINTTINYGIYGIQSSVISNVKIITTYSYKNTFEYVNLT